jgi:putative membrane protein
MKRETQNVLLLLLGLAVGVMVVKGAYLHYVKPALFPWLVASAAALVALAAICIAGDIRRGRGADVEDGHHHRGWMVWLLLVPVVLVAFIIPPPIEASGAAPVATKQAEKRAFPPLPPGPAPTVSVPEVMMRAVADSTGALDNRTITVIGFTLSGPAGPDLGRVVIVCCAADAQLARIHLAGPAAATAASLPEDTWLRVEGTVVPGSSTAASSFVPTLNITSATKIDRPANTYAY